MADPKSILVIVVARIGDTLLATPIVRALSEQYPEARVHVAAHPKRVELLDNLPFVASTIPLDKKRSPFRGWLPRKGYDLVLVYGHDAALIKYAHRVGRRVIAFAQPKPALNDLLDDVVAVPATLMHAVEERGLLLSPLNILMQNKRLGYVVDSAEKDQAQTWLNRHLPGDGPVYGLQPSSFPTKAYRDWPLDNFLEIGRRLLLQNGQARILVLGGPDGQALADQMAASLGERVSSVAGRFGLRGSFALMSLLDLYLGVDTGPTHVAGALGVPMVGLYHCQHPGRYLQPLQHPKGVFLEHPRTAGDCSRESDMSEISVESVWHAVTKVLQHV